MKEYINVECPNCSNINQLSITMNLSIVGNIVVYVGKCEDCSTVISVSVIGMDNIDSLGDFSGMASGLLTQMFGEKPKTVVFVCEHCGHERKIEVAAEGITDVSKICPECKKISNNPPKDFEEI